MKDIITEEKEHLEKTEEIIAQEIKKCIERDLKLKEHSRKLSYEDRLKGMHLHLNADLINNGKLQYDLEKSVDSPYFGRFDYKDDLSGIDNKFYIGKSMIMQDNNIIVHDWRSPICSLYYDSEVGPVSYKALGEVNNGELKLKRQIVIKNKNLISAVDTNLVSDDELLTPYLNISSDSRMKTIIASIQKEQNSIIRSDNANLIVQGVAGSGKTSVALHRIAYLLYLNRNDTKANNFLILGPNRCFLNYISTVLPDLDTTPVDQKTLLDLMNDFVGTNLKLSSRNVSKDPAKASIYRNICEFKGSMEYMELLDQFIENCFSGNGIVSEDFKIDGKTVFSADLIRDRLFGAGVERIDYDMVKRYFKNKFKENKNEIYNELNKEYRQAYMFLPFDDPERNIYIEKSNNLSKLVRKDGEKLLDKYFNGLKKSAVSLFVTFMSQIDKSILPLTEEETILMQQETLKSIKKGQILFEDIPALMYFNYKLTNKTLKYTNVVVDEAQDYSLFTYAVLKQIFGSAIFNIYGDRAQAIKSHGCIKDWDELKHVVFKDNCKICELSKSYRTTIEITNSSNYVLAHLNVSPAEPVIRHGSEVEYHDIDKEKDIIYKKIDEWVKSNYKNIAIICKNENVAAALNNELISHGIRSTFVSEENKDYVGGIFTISVESAKGLEFDCSIVYDASPKSYNENDDIDMHQLYVATTRAIHEQTVLYNKQVVKPFDQQIGMIRAKK